ncbi:MAG TPA: sigma 54-interacting transcriptional regulator [Acidimicrobiales bacterium]|nr:sigma 54-interacting transcriptional regulator [Acidimicrobiales bacterium]
MPLPAATTLAQLRTSGWSPTSVKDELRRNAMARIEAGRPLFEGLLGYDDTVLPQLENAVLAGHDVIFLGERGQGKTRMIRSLVGLLDEWLPVVAGSEINDDPFAPVSRYARDLVADHGDDIPIEWVHRDRRFGEKLATPDTSIADLIGEVDPIKVAEGRYLADESTLHFGLVPRTNRGIFAINELPDLAERIQVGLLNVLEERDVQVRGYKVRLPLDVVLVASANPEDYTNRGRIITPLKDRFGAQIRTHYPVEVGIEMAIADQEARPPASGIGRPVTVPDELAEVVATVSHLARSSPHVNQRSGVSVRLTVANRETLVANATRRALRLGEPEVVPRVSDLDALVASTAGKIEIETLDDGRDEAVVAGLFSAAVLTVFRRRVPADTIADLVAAFDDGRVVHTGDELPSGDYVELVASVPALRAGVSALAGALDSPAAVASAVEFLLEGLHLSKRLNKDVAGDGRAVYRSRSRR